MPALIELMHEFYAESDFQLDRSEAEASLRALLDDPALGCIWIAEHAGRPVGHVVLTVRFTMEHGAVVGYVDDLFVRPASRRMGVARALLTELAAECHRRHRRWLSVEVGQDNLPALGLYRSFGLGPHQDGRILLSGPC